LTILSKIVGIPYLSLQNHEPTSPGNHPAAVDRQMTGGKLGIVMDPIESIKPWKDSSFAMPAGSATSLLANLLHDD